MFRPRAHRLPYVLRLLATVLLALGLVLQPALASVAELHELAHVPASGQAHVEHADPAADELAAREQQEGTAGTLHTILQFAHCCSQAATTVPRLQALNPLPPMALAPIDLQQAPLHRRTYAPHRPPIA